MRQMPSNARTLISSTASIWKEHVEHTFVKELDECAFHQVRQVYQSIPYALMTSVDKTTHHLRLMRLTTQLSPPLAQDVLNVEEIVD